MWCVPCNAPVAVQVALHIGDTARPPAAEVTVCAGYTTPSQTGKVVWALFYPRQTPPTQAGTRAGQAATGSGT